MPIYEFQCERCGAKFDQLMSMKDPTPACPSCEAREVRKLVSAAGFVLKGGGWYKDHYGLKGGGSSPESKSEGGKTDGGTTEAPKTDAPKVDAPKVDAPKKTESKAAA